MAEKHIVEALKSKAIHFSRRFQPCWVCHGYREAEIGEKKPAMRQIVKKECKLCGGEGIIPRK